MKNGLGSRGRGYWKKQYRFFTQKVRRMVKIDVREMREKALQNLDQLAQEAHSHAMDKSKDEKERRDWARIAGFIYQTLNSVASEYIF